jgi:hypothetical protein
MPTLFLSDLVPVQRLDFFKAEVHEGQQQRAAVLAREQELTKNIKRKIPRNKNKHLFIDDDNDACFNKVFIFYFLLLVAWSFF